MAHARARHVLPLLMKKLRFSPVVAIQGARQTGKSFLVRELLPPSRKGLSYVSLDDFALRDLAERNPRLFLAQHEDAASLAIDEAQKSPRLFDAIKLAVDPHRQPGKFLLLGSTEFSRLSLIRESLTGRMSRIRLYPLNLSETLGLPPSKGASSSLLQESPRITRSQLARYLEHGGLPGIFAVRSAAERDSLLQDWLELTARRDAPLFPRIKIDPELCLRVLEQVAKLDDPDAGSIARALRRDARRIKTHLEALETLFAVHALDPHPSGTGKRRYFLCDVGLAGRLGASLHRRLQTLLLQEQLSQRAYRDDRDSKLFYYRTAKGSLVDLVIENRRELTLIKLLQDEALDLRQLEILMAYRRKHAELEPKLFALGGQRVHLKKERIQIYPWESMG